MSMAIIGVAVAAVGVGAGIYSIASAPGAPKNPDLVGASRGQVEAEAETLAERRRMEAAARQGGRALQRGYTQSTAADQRAQLQSQIDRVQTQLTAAYSQPGVVQYDLQTQLKGLQDQMEQIANIPAGETVFLNASGQYVPEGTAYADFTGFGEADVQGKVARDTAQNILDLNAKYGPQFIEEALRQEELADPEGAAARRKLYELVMQQANEHPDRPVAELLDKQVAEQLTAGKGLDRMSGEMLDQAVRESQRSRGEEGQGGTDFAEPLTTGFQGQQRLSAAQQKALGWLTSGATPEDVQYRRGQQTLANLSDFANARTPQSQFQSLSGAQQGPAPYAPGPAGPSANPNAGTVGQNAALSTWNTKNQFNQNQVDPWMAGLSSLLSGVNVAAGAGAFKGG